MRALAVTPAVLLVAAAASASAATPDTWPVSHNPSKAASILTLAGWTLGVYVVVWLLAALPGILRSGKFDESTAFVEQPEWFGGPRRGADAAASDAESKEPSETGGAGANW